MLRFADIGWNFIVFSYHFGVLFDGGFTVLPLFFLGLLLSHTEAFYVDTEVVGVVSLRIELYLPFMAADGHRLRLHHELSIGILPGAIVVLDCPLNAACGPRGVLWVVKWRKCLLLPVLVIQRADFGASFYLL
jgi:hypothetical protein